MTVDPEPLAEKFAEELTSTVQAIAPDSRPFLARVSEHHGSTRMTVRQEPSEGFDLTVGGQPLLRVTARYHCMLDSAETWLAIEDSKIAVLLSGADRAEPLFRYEYVRDPGNRMPAAHIQVHAHRNELGFALASAGSSSRRSGTSEATSALHFPVGGHRMRPCLEDVLEMLVYEFGIDCPTDGIATMQKARERWRRQQIRSATRDAPADAADALRALGYIVTPPTPEPSDNVGRLQAL